MSADVKPSPPAAVPEVRPERVFAVAFAAQMLALTGFKLVWPFLPLWLAHLGVPGRDLPLWTGSLDFAEELTTAVVSPFWGLLGDMYGRKPMVVRAMLGGAAVIILITAAPNAYVVLGLMVLSGAVTGVMAPLTAIVSSSAPPDRLNSYLGRMLSSVFIAGITGPLIGGALGDRLGLRGGFACGSAFLLVAAALVFFLIHEAKPSHAGRAAKGGRGARGHGFLAQFRTISQIPGFMRLMYVIGAFYFAAMVIYPVLAVMVLHLTGVISVGGKPLIATSVGVVFGASGATATIAAWRAQAVIKRLGYRTTLLTMAAGSGLITLSMFFSHSFWYLVFVRAACGVLSGIAQTAVSALVGRVIPATMHATGYGIVGSVQSVVTAVALLAGGWAGSVISLWSVFLLSGVSLLVAVAVTATFRISDLVQPDATAG